MPLAFVLRSTFSSIIAWRKAEDRRVTTSWLWPRPKQPRSRAPWLKKMNGAAQSPQKGRVAPLRVWPREDDCITTYMCCVCVCGFELLGGQRCFFYDFLLGTLLLRPKDAQRTSVSFEFAVHLQSLNLRAVYPVSPGTPPESSAKEAEVLFTSANLGMPCKSAQPSL